MYNGILPVFKERGLTSHDVVFKLRKILNTKKIGHTGTLDPEVSGVLPICVGPATRVSDYVMEMGKAYEATVTIGRSTTTEDQTGETVEHKSVTETDLTEQQVDHVIKQFEGTIEQIPPMYSSVKVNGKRLYEYARNNETVERPIRQAIIKNIKRISPLRFDGEECHFDIAVSCGKGTYIRTLATDIGAKLGYPAHMSLLTRIESGGFNLEQSLSLEDIKNLHEHDSLQDKLFPIEYGLKGLPQQMVTDDQIKQRILNGQKFYKKQFENINDDQFVFVDNASQKVLAIYIIHPDKPEELKPKKVFN
ncbi:MULTISPECIES: tRNA pseudouridine(55) synthase TruB [Staphylococcus]|uniref:tRNA pseudouridine(55) synthase TruB n=1 Tax=Staphylococcus TaxID=1279 RepID=UPI0002FAF87C|nr:MULTISPECIES: tRNA pseudouridine(55) synthase TruB [Staphylococcus]MBM6507169.1 tRNA pseudouridine(55) synthase TruB [Staphylococcus pasteuri]MCD9065589.1 tRNA pseudouridine(55) synthase TruB [Staphylococcus pasteuri]PTU84181.1 tRNA pseudouridine(55) synthase TruB [Staphylococcus pasteuri]QQT21071.1 tRNA pseudouridine(55) synthase TruB [Staphylococcus pasteuri]RIO37942.1 tRNA pseudouridine(55) synthase TruB [Staphylococcus pasteuri]